MVNRKLFNLLLVIMVSVCFVSFVSTSNAAQIKVACIGDSITMGFGTTNAKLYSYPAQLQNLCGPAYIVKNFGLGGRTLLKKGDHPYWKEHKYAESKKWQPDIVIIQLGTNDTKSNNWAYKSEFVGDYIELVNSYKNLPSQPKVYICYPSALYVVNLSESIIVKEVIPMIDQIAVRTGSTIIDNHTPTTDMAQFFPDLIHPDNTAAFALAYNVFKSLGIPNAGVELFQDSNSGGMNYPLPVGAYSGAILFSMGISNDWKPSLKVPGGYTVEVYQYGDFSGDKWTFTGDVPDLGSACNGQMSSVRISNIISGATYKIINRLSGKGLNVPNGSTANNAKLIQRPYGGNSNEKWVITRNSDGTYKIQNAFSMKYIEAHDGSTADGAAIVQYTEKSGDTQNWNISVVDGGYYKITSAATGKAICVKGLSAFFGAKIIQGTANAGQNDEWALLAP